MVRIHDLVHSPQEHEERHGHAKKKHRNRLHTTFVRIQEDIEDRARPSSGPTLVRGPRFPEGAVSWIRSVPEGEATGRLAEVYQDIVRRRGKLSNIMRVQSLQPDAMEAHLDLYMALMFRKGGLSRAERELLAVAVSVENGCEYCTVHHASALEAWWKDPERVERLRADPGDAGLSVREGALVEYALALTRNPSAVDQTRVGRLREAGLPDEEILQANMIVAYFNFVNRIAEGLGVEVTPEEAGGYKV